MKKSYICIILSTFLFNCNSEDNKTKALCGDPILVDAILFQQEPSTDFIIQNAEINEDCISITILSGGCDMSTWQADLVTDGIQTDAIPPNRLIRMNFISSEPCEAAFITTYKFDLGPETQTVIYSLFGWEGELIHND